MWLLVALGSAWATDIYRAELADGTLVFTDSPGNSGFELYIVDGRPPPTRKRVNHATFPLLDTWDGYILASAARYGVPAALVKAVVLAESGMNPNAISRSGAMGLMQLMPATASGLGVDDPWDPEQNIDGGTRYLRQMIERFSDNRRAVAAYNAGPANVEKFNGVPPFEETQVYVVRVLDLYDMFRHERPVVLHSDAGGDHWDAPEATPGGQAAFDGLWPDETVPTP